MGGRGDAALTARISSPTRSAPPTGAWPSAAAGSPTASAPVPTGRDPVPAQTVRRAPGSPGRAVSRRFEDTPITRAWHGVLGVARDWCPRGRIRPQSSGLAFAGGYAGEGRGGGQPGRTHAAGPDPRARHRTHPPALGRELPRATGSPSRCASSAPAGSTACTARPTGVEERTGRRSPLAAVGDGDRRALDGPGSPVDDTSASPRAARSCRSLMPSRSATRREAAFSGWISEMSSGASSVVQANSSTAAAGLGGVALAPMRCARASTRPRGPAIPRAATARPGRRSTGRPWSQPPTGRSRGAPSGPGRSRSAATPGRGRACGRCRCSA